jgi:hypothetical protein
VEAHDPDYGEVVHPGFLGRLFGRRPKIVKDANLAAAAASLPRGAGIIGKDPNGCWIVYEMPNGAQQVRFCAREAWRGGVAQAPGWLDFSYDPSAFRDTPSARAVSEVLGGDPDAPLVPAR